MGNWFVQMGKNAEASGQGGANAGNNPPPGSGIGPTPRPTPPAVPTIPYMPQQQLFSAAPQQRDIQNNFSTSQQYAQRYGQSGSHF